MVDMIEFTIRGGQHNHNDRLAMVEGETSIPKTVRLGAN